jgi:hypothetical protein
VNPLGSKFVFSIKLRSDGSIERYKAQLVVLGNNKNMVSTMMRPSHQSPKWSLSELYSLLLHLNPGPYIKWMSIMSSFMVISRKTFTWNFLLVCLLPHLMMFANWNVICMVWSKHREYSLTSFDPRCLVSLSLKVSMTPLSFYKTHPWASLSSLFMWMISSSLALTWRQYLRFRLCYILHSTFHMKDLG